jgi:hypothetical protein
MIKSNLSPFLFEVNIAQFFFIDKYTGVYAFIVSMAYAL